jgi:DNA-3-methyladenine glycosylase
MAKQRTLGREFYAGDAATVARGLIGKVLVHRVGARTYRARLVETEAYMGPGDLASHAAKGRTRRTEVMFGPAGRAYVYLIYGMYQMLNVVTGVTGEAHAVLFRAAEPLDDWDADLSGPGKLARAFRITPAENGTDMTDGKLFVVDDGGRPVPRIVTSKRIGVDYAQHWAEEHLRFYDADSGAVSKLRAAKVRKSRG